MSNPFNKNNRNAKPAQRGSPTLSKGPSVRYPLSVGGPKQPSKFNAGAPSKPANRLGVQNASPSNTRVAGGGPKPRGAKFNRGEW